MPFGAENGTVEMGGAEMFVTTEKDAVRIPKVDTGGLPFMFLRVEIRILKGSTYFQDCIRSICMK